MIGPEIFSAVNHVLNNYSEFRFSEYLRLNQVADIEFNELVNLVLVCKDIHNVSFLIVCAIATTTSNCQNSRLDL